MSARISHAGALLFLLGLFIPLFPAAAERCSAYIVPAEQIIDFMTGNFSGFSTLTITQSTLRTPLDGNGASFTEQVITASPDLFRLQMLDRGQERPDPPDMRYRQLLMANPGERIQRLLTGMGIDLDTVYLTRMDGVVAYGIGHRQDQGPKLLVEKERFLPLLLVYRTARGSAGDTVTVRFQDYRRQDKGWFPFEITCTVGDRVREHYTVLAFQAGVPVESAMLRPFDRGPGAERSPEKRVPDVEERHLQETIKAFEEKYR